MDDLKPSQTSTKYSYAGDLFSTLAEAEAAKHEAEARFQGKYLENQIWQVVDLTGNAEFTIIPKTKPSE